MAVVKKTVAPVAAKVEAPKAEVKKAAPTTPVKTETKTAVKEAEKAPVAKAEEKAPVKAEVKKPAAKKETVKKETKKAAPAKAEAKKPAVRRTAKKAAVAAEEIFIQYAGKEFTTKDVVANVKKAWTEMTGKKEEDIQDIKVYVKTEENKAYYVVNGEAEGHYVEL